MLSFKDQEQSASLENRDLSSVPNYRRTRLAPFWRKRSRQISPGVLGEKGEEGQAFAMHRRMPMHLIFDLGSPELSCSSLPVEHQTMSGSRRPRPPTPGDRELDGSCFHGFATPHARADHLRSSCDLGNAGGRPWCLSSFFRCDRLTRHLCETSSPCATQEDLRKTLSHYATDFQTRTFFRALQ